MANLIADHTSVVRFLNTYVQFFCNQKLICFWFVFLKATELKPIAHYLSLVTPIDLLMTSRGMALSLIGSQGKQLLLHTTFSQPHTVISTKPGAERVEISCYNMGILTGKPNKSTDKGNCLF